MSWSFSIKILLKPQGPGAGWGEGVIFFMMFTLVSPNHFHRIVFIPLFAAYPLPILIIVIMIYFPVELEPFVDKYNGLFRFFSFRDMIRQYLQEKNPIE